MARNLFVRSTISSLLPCLAVAFLWPLSYRHPEELDAGYWHYQQHGTYKNYYDAWFVRAFSSRGRMVMGIYRHGCIAGPGRYEQTPGEKGNTSLSDPGAGIRGLPR
jgi:hypothetical protein